MITQSYKYFYKRFLQYVAFFSSLNYYFLSKNAKAPEAGKPASRAFMVNFILLSVPNRTSSDNGTELHG